MIRRVLEGAEGTTSSAPAGRRPFARRHPVLTGVLGLVGAVLVAVALVVLTPLFDARISADPDPATSYAHAMEKAEDLLGADGPEIDPRCRSRVYDQGETTDRAVVLLHGYTNCPQQFEAIAEAYAEAGYSVVVPRLPGHGYSDRLTRALSEVDPGRLVDVGDQAVDIAAGLGDEVAVVGLSGGGTVAGWLAANRSEVTDATLIAPLVVPKVLPEFAVAPVARAFRFAPDVYLWWDGALKEELADPPYAYPRYSLRSLGAFLAVGRDAQSGPPPESLQRLVVVTNDNDSAVSNAGVEELADAITGPQVERVEQEFSADLQYRHDLVDPEGENADSLVDIYPVLGPLLGLPELSAPGA